jgi:hypothetical protein
MIEKLKKIFNKLSNIDSQIIEFIPSDINVEKFIPAPEPAKNLIPQWYKEKSTNDPKFLDQNKIPKHLKMCMPFLDAISGGYIQKTWCDINIVIDDDNRTVDYFWSAGPKIIGHRDHLNIPINESLRSLEMIWIIPWLPKVPEDYSLFVTHPCNRLDLPFTTLTGIIDADDFYHIGFGQLPFYLNRSFNGIIPAGTPMFQMFPIKREKWKSKNHIFNQDEREQKEYTARKEFFGVYKNKFWKKKSYE